MSLNERLNVSNLYSSGADLGNADDQFIKKEVELELQELKSAVIARLSGKYGGSFSINGHSNAQIEALVIEAVAHVIDNRKKSSAKVDRAFLVQSLLDELIGNGPIEPFLRDPSVTEIMVNSFDQVFIERKGKIYPAKIKFENEMHLRSTIERIVSRVGRRIDESSPMVDARLPDGSRVNAVISPIALDGSSITIRKFAIEKLTIADLISNHTLTPQVSEYLEACVKGKLNVLISGGTGSGKTTTLNVLSSFIPESERIVTIEDSAELQLNKPHVVRLESRPVNIEGKGQISIRDLVKNSLRMRPDRIIVGEVRDAATFDMLQAMNTGHEGSLTTVHANSPQDALSRIESMSLMAGMEIPLSVIREQVAQSIHVVLQQARLVDGSRKVTSISEIIGFENNQIQLQNIFTFQYEQKNEDSVKGRLELNPKIKSIFGEKISNQGVKLNSSIF